MAASAAVESTLWWNGDVYCQVHRLNRFHIQNTITQTHTYRTYIPLKHKPNKTNLELHVCEKQRQWLSG